MSSGPALPFAHSRCDSARDPGMPCGPEKRFGNYQDWFWNEDYYLWVRMMMNHCVFANIPDVAVNVRSGADQYARRGGKKYFDSEIGIKKLMLKNGMITQKEYL